MDNWKMIYSKEFVDLIHKALQILEMVTERKEFAAYADRYRNLKAELEALEVSYKFKQIDRTLPDLKITSFVGMQDAIGLVRAVGEVNNYYREHISIVHKKKAPPTPPKIEKAELSQKDFRELIQNALQVLEKEMGLEKNAEYVDRYRSMKAELEALEQAYQSNQIDRTLPCLYVVKLLGLYDSLELLDAVGALNSFYRKHLWIVKPPEMSPDRFVFLIHYAIAVVEKEMGEKRNAGWLPRYNNLVSALQFVMRNYMNNRLSMKDSSLGLGHYLEDIFDTKELMDAVYAVDDYYQKYIYVAPPPKPPSPESFVNLIHIAMETIEQKRALEKNAIIQQRYYTMQKELECIEKEYKSGTLDCKSVQLSVIRLLDQSDPQILLFVVGAVNGFYQAYLRIAD